ncbi:MAG: discoidin domain-containing protein, partial [Alistipes sp.]|nr:discoidin domain-containing protein [Alistipes sp.]
HGEMNGTDWVPGESDISIRPGWFYSPGTDNFVKSIDKLVDIYYSSLGRNTNLLLNVPPDRTGRIHRNDSLRLMEFRAELERMFSDNLAAGARAESTDVRGGSRRFAPERATDGNYDTYWTVDDNVLQPSIEIPLETNTTFDNIILQEYIPLGQRVVRFSVDYLNPDGSWQRLDAGTTTTIGYKRILRFGAVTASRVRINIEESLACPVINNIEIYHTGR